MEAILAVPTYAELVQAGEAQLRAAGIDSARLDAEILVAFAAATDRTGLYAQLHAAAPGAVADRAASLFERRVGREPLAYITGVQEFWSLPFAVTPAVLIPRPETELLVEIACRLVSDRSVPTPAAICDLGSGSGCLAVALARELSRAQLVATDISDQALAVAARNAAAHRVDGRILFRHGDLFAACDDDADFDLIVCNPPYLAPHDATSPELAFEPPAALAGGADGLAIIRRVIAAAPQRLRPGGWLLMEIGYGQAPAVGELARDAGLVDIAIEPDLAGILRALMARRGTGA